MRQMVQGSAMVLALAAASGAAASEKGEAKLAKLLEGRTAGPPVTCINSGNLVSTEIVDQTAIVYRTSGGKLYVNRPRTGAADLNHDDTLVTRTMGARLCGQDVVTVFEPGSSLPAGLLSLGAFTPYVKVQP